MDRLKLIRQSCLARLRRRSLARLRARYAALLWAGYGLWMGILASTLIAVTPFITPGIEKKDGPAFAVLGVIFAIDCLVLYGLSICEFSSHSSGGTYQAIIRSASCFASATFN